VKVNYLRPGVVGAEDLTATGTVIHRGRSLAIARAEVTQGGKQVAVATGSTSLRS
jgi:acyl-coenzyme A thioesterase PaaI-like protein